MLRSHVLVRCVHVIVPQVHLASDKKYRDPLPTGELQDFRHPSLLRPFQCGHAAEIETNEKSMCTGIEPRSQTATRFVTRRAGEDIPKGETNGFATAHFDVDLCTFQRVWDTSLDKQRFFISSDDPACAVAYWLASEEDDG